MWSNVELNEENEWNEELFEMDAKKLKTNG